MMLAKAIGMFRRWTIIPLIIDKQILTQKLKTTNSGKSLFLNINLMNRYPGKNIKKIKEKIDLNTMKNKSLETKFAKKIIQTIKIIVTE